MPRSTRPLAPLALLSVLALTLGACSTGGGVERGSAQQVHLVASLRPMSSCDELLNHLQREAMDRVGPYGFDGGGVIVDDFGAAEGDASAADDLAAPAPSDQSFDAASGAASPGLPTPPRQTETDGPDVSSTNVQEAGVDEPDIVKADGERILAVAGGTLYWVDVTDDDAPEVVGSVALPEGFGQQILINEDRALVLVGDGGQPVPLEGDVATDSFTAPPVTQSSLVEVDISSPQELDVVDTMEVDGRILDARMVGGVARVVVTSQPDGLSFVYPSDGSDAAIDAAEATNRQIIHDTDLSDWVPGASTAEGPLVPCEQMEVPDDFSGFGTLAILTHDLNGRFGGFDNGQATGILADGEHVYASTNRLYVATTQHPEAETDPSNGFPAPPVASTAIHRFSIDEGGPARYEMSGAVRGRLLDQFSMSEDDDNLRVATTDDLAQESFVTVLGPADGAMTELGQVGGIGEGEQIYSVRFIDDVGYVVTFRQTDPLYTVDVSDPAHPTVAGELELLGYSAYLHPAGDGLLLGVGQEADASGTTSGLQISLFDVSDPADPQRLQQISVPGGNSDAEFDHHAFLFWPETGLAVLPVQRWGAADALASEDFTGALGFHIDPEGIERVGQVIHEDGSELTRSVVVRDQLYTLSDTSVVASRLDNLLQNTVLPLS